MSEYDKWNNIKLRTTFDKDNVLIEKTISIYNTNNYKTEENTFDKDGKLVRKVVMEYDQKGMLISRKFYNEKNEMTFSKVFTYTY
ncbi:MAG: hypothetical protein IPP29_10755 [Bacteroidetes bacterium]|nr:hypothetical protein [Bacteroidota bacterium]